MHGLNEYDYGARQYDPAIGKFTTMDPLCEKYYHISPYAYCGGNPVNYIDSNGDSIFVIIGKKNELLYDNQTLYYKDGSLYEGKNKFAKKAMDELNKIYQTDIGKDLINELSRSKNVFKITKNYYSHFNSRVNDIIKYSRTSNEIPNSGGGLIFWKTSGTWIDTTNGLKRNPTVDLAHELFHAQDTNNGRLSEEEYNYLSINEWRASYNENLFRKQIGTSLRTLYKSVDQNKKQHIVPLLDADGNPWKPY